MDEVFVPPAGIILIACLFYVNLPEVEWAANILKLAGGRRVILLRQEAFNRIRDFLAPESRFVFQPLAEEGYDTLVITDRGLSKFIEMSSLGLT